MKHRIMVIDDEPQVRELLSLYLMKKGYNVIDAGSSAESLDLLQRNAVEVVVLDIGLGDEDGLKLLPMLKAQKPNLKVVLLTGMGFVEDLLEEAHQKGADGYVSKALPLDELLQAIERVLNPDQSTPAAEAA